MAIDTFEIRHQMNEEAAELESLRSETRDLELVIDNLECTVSDLENENRKLKGDVIIADSYADEVSERSETLTEAIRGALEDLRTLPEVPLNLIEAAVENIIDDLSAVIRDA